MEPEPEAWHHRLLALPVTAGLIALCVAGFAATVSRCLWVSSAPDVVLQRSLWSLGSCREAMVTFGALELGRLWVDGEWSRVLWTGLLHGSVLHLTLNVWSLFSVGEWAEQVWGRWRFLLLFLASSIGGCLASVAWAEAPMVVGASAGVFGIAGALVVGRILGRGRVGEAFAPIRIRMLAGCLVALLVIGAVVPVIAQAGHLGGLAVGAGLGLAWSRGGWSALVGWGVTLSVLVALVVLAAGPAQFGKRDALLGYRLLELHRYDDAADAFEAALAAEPGDATLANAVAYALVEAGVRLDRARALVLTALATEPENPDFLDTLGWIECRRGETGAGQDALERARAAAKEAVPEIEEHLRRCADEGGLTP